MTFDARQQLRQRALATLGLVDNAAGQASATVGTMRLWEAGEALDHIVEFWNGFLEKAEQAVSDPYEARNLRVPSYAWYAHAVARELGVARNKLGEWLPSFSQDRHTANRDGYRRFLSDENWPLVPFVSQDQPVSIPTALLNCHCYIAGTTGSGKSELMKLMIRAAIDRGDSAVVVMDPHGELTEQVARWQLSDPNRLVYVTPEYQRHGASVVLNPLELPNQELRTKDIVSQELGASFEEMLRRAGGALTVNMDTLVRNCLLVLLETEAPNLTDLQRFMRDNDNGDLVALGRRHWHPPIARFFEHDFDNTNYRMSRQAVTGKLQNLLGSVTFHAMTVGKSTVELEQAIQERKIIVLNLGMGLMGREASDAFGRLVLARLFSLALRRQDRPKSERVPVYLFIDECQNYLGESIQATLTEARKYGLYATLAQPSVGLGMTPSLKNAVLQSTNVKFLGLAQSPKNVAEVATMTGFSPQEAGSLSVGEFITKCERHPAFLLRTYTHLLDNAGALDEAGWQAAVADQLNRYTRPLIMPSPPSSAALSHETEAVAPIVPFDAGELR